MGNSLIPTHLTDDELLILRERLDPNGERTHAWLAVDYIHQNPGALARDVQERCNTSEALGSLIRNRRINERLAAFGLELQCAKDPGEWVFRWYLCRTEPGFPEALADLVRRYPEARHRLPQYADELLAAEA